jgi:hypothetical protein
MDEIDKLLAEVKHEYIEKPKAQPSHPQQRNTFTFPSIKSTPDKLGGVDKLLADVKADFEEKDLATELQRQQELEVERLRAVEEQQRKREALKHKAKAWLSELEPLSPEGLWFEKFSQGYPTQLDAAIEYLEGFDS